MLQHSMEIVRASEQDIEAILALNQLLKVEAPEFKGNTQVIFPGNFWPG